MPFDLSGGAGNLLSMGGETENSFLFSSFYTALIMTTLIIIIVLTMYPCSRKATVWQRIKTFLYIFAGTFFVLVLHKGTIKKVLGAKQKEQSSERILGGMGEGNVVSDSVPVELSQTSVNAGDVFQQYGV